MKNFGIILLSLLCIAGGLYAQEEPINDTVYMTVKGNYVELTVAFSQGAETEVYLSTGDGACTYISKGNDTARWWYYYNYEGEYQLKLFAKSGDLKSRLFGVDFRQDVGFTSLDVSGCTALQRLKLRPLNSLNVSGCTSLTHLECNARALDASGCTSLTHLICSAHTLDVSGCSSLMYLSCSWGNLTSLDVSDCIALDTLRCCWGNLTSLDVSKNAALTYLDCSSNQLTSLDVSKNMALTYLFCRNNQLTSLNVSGCKALTYLDCRGVNHGTSNLISLNVSECVALDTLYCSNNQLTSLDISKNAALTYLDCSYNNLPSLDVSGCTSLMYLDCVRNSMTTLDLSKNTAMQRLMCYSERTVVLDELGCFDLRTLTGFDMGKVQDCKWEGGILSGNMVEFQRGNVIYEYPTNCVNPSCAFGQFCLIDGSPVAMPSIVIEAFSIGGYRRVFLSTTTPDATIFYTTDGSEPTKFSLQNFPGSFVYVPEVAGIIKAIAIKGGVKSRVATATFGVLPNTPALSAPTLRVYASDKTIYLSEPCGEVEVFTLSGRRVYCGVSTAIPVPSPGVYIVTAAGRKYKIGVR